MFKYVWYASYGSNLLRNRFLRYILGGTADGANFTQIGCKDKTLPLADEKITIPHKLYFADKFHGWENKGVLYVKRERDNKVKTLSQMYLISIQQFKEVVSQENCLEFFDDKIKINFNEAIEKGFSELPLNGYNLIIHLGNKTNYPIFTFTSKRYNNEIDYNCPGPNYINMIVRGLKEAYNIKSEEIVNYLSNISGIRGILKPEEIVHLIK